MERLRRGRIYEAIALAVGLVALSASLANAREQLRVCWEAELKPPYLSEDEGNLTGLAVY